jgi:hypothetical protein
MWDWCPAIQLRQRRIHKGGSRPICFGREPPHVGVASPVENLSHKIKKGVGEN